MKREKFNDKVTPNYNKKTPVHYVYLYTSWPVILSGGQQSSHPGCEGPRPHWAQTRKKGA